MFELSLKWIHESSFYFRVYRHLSFVLIFFGRNTFKINFSFIHFLCFKEIFSKLYITSVSSTKSVLTCPFQFSFNENRNVLGNVHDAGKSKYGKPLL